MAASQVSHDITTRTPEEQDIAAQKRIEEALQQERILLRTVIDNLPDPIYAKDRNSRKTLANLADVQNIGLPFEAEVLGKGTTSISSRKKWPRNSGFADDQTVIHLEQPGINRGVLDVCPWQGPFVGLSSNWPLCYEKVFLGPLGVSDNTTREKNRRWLGPPPAGPAPPRRRLRLWPVRQRSKRRV